MSLRIVKQIEQTIENSENQLNSKYSLFSTNPSMTFPNQVTSLFSCECVQSDDKLNSKEDLKEDLKGDSADFYNEDDCTQDEDEYSTLNENCCCEEEENKELESSKKRKYNDKEQNLDSSQNKQPDELNQNQQIHIDEINSFALDPILPCTVGNLHIKKLSWRDFQGTPNYEQKWSAHAFWGINYNYKVEQKTGKNKKVCYSISVEVNVWLKKQKSWAKRQNPHLLNHEQGHYIIGCLCALEFKKQVLQYSFTDNYRFEIPRLFQKILKEYITKEKRYDKETNHRLNREKQIEWDHYMFSQINNYSTFFLQKQHKQTPIPQSLQTIPNS